MNWYKLSQADLDLEDELNALLQRLRDKYPLEQLEAWIPSYGKFIDLANIRVKVESRGQGVGHKVIRAIQDFATAHGLPIRLSPEADRGRKGDLYRFYRSLGFVPNKGQKKDYRLSAPFAPTMYWKPKVRRDELV